MACEYVKQHYSVPADIGRIVLVNGRSGVIAADHGHYIGVAFDDSDPDEIVPCHPTWEVEYRGMGVLRQPRPS